MLKMSVFYALLALLTVNLLVVPHNPNANEPASTQRCPTIKDLKGGGYQSIPSCLALPWGRIELSNNEVSIISTVEDPPGVRLAAAAGGSLGKLSFNRLRPDGRQEEVVKVIGTLDERYPQAALAGAITLHLRRPYGDGDRGMVRIGTARHDGVVFHVPAYQER